MPVMSARSRIFVFGITVIACLLTKSTSGLNNGLALTPPMGWMSWQRFRCITDCEKYPDECISERLVKRTADLMVENGFLAAGYEYLIIDDCWLEEERSPEGHLQEDHARFPHGMKALGDYIHSKGLKFGIYENYGNKTCAGYPGLYGNEKNDINLLASWGIDYIKVDGCNFYGNDFSKGYEELKNILNSTGRPIVYSCSYPAYEDETSTPINFELLAENCNLWRNYQDIDDSWSSLVDILDYFALKQDHIAKFSGPGHWNDPDMLLIGNYGLSHEQSKSQMALWAILAAPLLMSTDLKTMRLEHREILLNKKIIAINQDPLGIQGLRVFRKNDIEVWTRKVSPVNIDHHSYAIAVLSKRYDGAPYEFVTTLLQIGLRFVPGYTIEDLYTGESWTGIYHPNSNLTVRVPPSGVVFLKATVMV